MGLALGLPLLRRLRGSTFVRDSALVFIATMAVNVAAYVFHAAVSRMLGVVDYGTLYALLALLPIAGFPAGVITIAIVKFAAEFRAAGDAAHVHALYTRILGGLGALSVVVLVLTAIFHGAVGAFLHVPIALLMPTAALVCTSLLLPSVRSVLQGTQDFVQFAVSSGLEGFFKTAIAIAFVAIGWGVLGAIAGYVLGSCISLGYTWILLYLRYRAVPATPLRLDWRRLFMTMWGGAVVTLTLAVLSYGDVVLVKHYMSASDAGLYASVSLTGKILLFVAGFVPTVLLPKAVDHVHGNRDPLPILLGSLGLVALLCAGGLVVFAVAPALVLRSLVGGDFLSAAHLLFGYGLAMSLLAGMSLIGNYKIALHRFDFIVPFCAVAIGELTMIAVHHPNLHAVIETLIIGNALGFLASLYRIRRPAPLAHARS